MFTGLICWFGYGCVWLVRWLNVHLLVVWLWLCMVGLLVRWLNVDLLVVWLWLCMVC